MATKLGEDIINFYKPYRNHNADWKTTIISKQKFEIYGRYEIIDVSIQFFTFSWSGSIRNRRGCKGQVRY